MITFELHWWVLLLTGLVFAVVVIVLMLAVVGKLSQALTHGAWMATQSMVEKAERRAYMSGVATSARRVRHLEPDDDSEGVEDDGPGEVRDDIPITSLPLPDLMLLDLLNGTVLDDAKMQFPSGLLVSGKRLQELRRERAGE